MAEGDGTIEKALEVTRNLHRLILSISVVTLVFATTLRQSDSVRAQRDAIESFLKFDFSRYDDFIDEALKEFSEASLRSTSEALKQEFEKAAEGVVGSHALRDVFAEPLATLRFRTRESLLSAPSAASLRHVKSFGGLLPPKTNIQVAVPDTVAATEQIIEFLEANASAGQRVDSADLSMANDDPATRPPQASDRIPLTLYFVLQSNRGGSPVFVEQFYATVEEIPDTSFYSWLREQHGTEAFVSFEDGELSWLPALGSLPWELAEKRLGDVLANLEDALRRERLENQTVSLVGVSFPGNLLTIAIPLVLMALSYYLLFHIKHLGRFAAKHPAVMERFAWLPLSKGPGWFPECLISMAVLPATAIFLFGLQLFRFSLIGWVSGFYLLVSVAVVSILARRSIQELSALRSQFGRASPIAWRLPWGSPRHRRQKHS